MFSNDRTGDVGRAVAVGVMHDGLGERVLGLALDRGRQGEELPLVDAVDEHVGDLGLALGERAGLVHDDDVDPCGGLERESRS